MLDKIYKNKDKFSSIDDNFNFKVTIFYNKYWWVGLLSNVYIHSAFIILSSQTQIHFYANYDNISIFDQFCTNM